MDVSLINQAEELRQKIEQGWKAAERSELLDGPTALKSLLWRVQKKAKAKKKTRDIAALLGKADES